MMEIKMQKSNLHPQFVQHKLPLNTMDRNI